MNNHDTPIEISISEIIAFLKTKSKSIIITGLSTAIVAFVYFGFIKDDLYQSEGLIIFNFTQPTTTEFGDYSLISPKTNDYLHLLEDPRIGIKTLNDLNIDNELSFETLSNNMLYINDLNNEGQSVKIKLSLQNENCNQILDTYIDNYIELLNSILTQEALNYFHDVYSVKIKLFEIQNEEIAAQIKNIEELMSTINKSVPKDQLLTLKKEGIQVNLSDVLNANYLLLEGQLIDNKRRFFNNEVTINTSQEYINKISLLKDSISANAFTHSVLNIIGNKALVVKPPLDLDDNPISKGIILKSFIAFILGIIVMILYNFYRFIIVQNQKN